MIAGLPRPLVGASGHRAWAQAAGQGEGVVGVVERDLDLVTGASGADADVGAEGRAEGVGDARAGGLLVWVDGGAAALGRARRGVGLAGALLDDADRPAA